MATFDLMFNYEEALKRLNRCQEEVDELRSLLKPIDNVPESVTDKLLLCFLNACDGVEDTIKVISQYYKTKKSCPQIFTNRDPYYPGIQQCFQNQLFIKLPVTPDNYSVIHFGLSNSTASNYIHEQNSKTFIMALDALISHDGPQNGLIASFDLENFRISHLSRFKLNHLKLFFTYTQECLAVKIKAIHVFNSSSIVKLFLAFMKPFLKPEIINMINLHPTTMDYEKFDGISKSSLPSNYGGDLASVVELHDENCQQIQKMRAYFLAEEKQFTM